jgi:hypothetical protein
MRVWYKSSYSAGNGDCVEVASTPADVHVRDTKDRPGGTLAFESTSWRMFLVRLKPQL